jgi:DtxR family Mn-dependent transcriptional regulator
VAEYQTREFHPAFEEYCEAIWELKEDEVEVIQARVAERLNVSRPAVSEMIRRMQNEGFVALEGTTINLTAAGRHLAERVVRRHRLAERLLTDVLGLPWADAHVEAGKWEHVISEPVERAINRVLDNPTTCPHGNPIPGSSYAPPDMSPLADLPVGSTFTVTRIPEELEFTPGLLEFLEGAAVQPGRTGTVTATSPDGTTTVEIDGQHVGIGSFASARILVTVAATTEAGTPQQAAPASIPTAAIRAASAVPASPEPEPAPRTEPEPGTAAAV